MDIWMEHFCHGLDSASDAEDIFGCVVRAAAALGFEHCAYGARRPLPMARPRTLLLNSYDSRWQHRYVAAGYLAIDPVVAHGGRHAEPVIWSDALFRRSPQMWEEARGFGLAVGWSQSCFDAQGNGGLVSVARSHEALSAIELREKEPALRWLVNVAHLALSAALLREEQPRSLLTGREDEILRWTADGKTSPEIAQILQLSVNTVNFHVKHALAKLGAATKASAVACLIARFPHGPSTH
ncbi:LuxR family transcriptional regulator [Variovorax sp. LARHSF232]